MERLITLLFAGTLLTGAVRSQTNDDARRAIRLGNEAYRKGDLGTAAEQYGRASTDRHGAFNLGNTLYRTDSTAAAQRAFETAAALAQGADEQARAYHNLGNSWMARQQYKEAINAYKEALKRAPRNEDTRYNLAYAQKKLAQQQQQQQDKNDEKQKDKEGNKDQQQDQADKDPKQDEPKENKEDPKEPQERKQRPGQIDPKDAERMLDAMQQQEKDTQQKAREKVRVKPRTPIEKDW